VIIINWAWLKINWYDLVVNFKLPSEKMNRFKQSGADTFFWVIWAIAITAMIAIKFY
jgi:hypothetical protein